MELIALKILIGFLVGILIGMTGLGGGVLLLPLPIFLLRVPAIVAVGSDALFNFVTKIPARAFLCCGCGAFCAGSCWQLTPECCGPDNA